MTDYRYEVWAKRTDDQNEWRVIHECTHRQAVDLANALSECAHIDYALPVEVGI